MAKQTKHALKAQKLSEQLAEAQAKSAAEVAASPQRLADRLAVREGFELAAVDPDSSPGFSGKKADGEAALAAGALQLGDLQEKLWAQSRAGDPRSLLLVLQGMDTSGKGGILRHVVGACDPQGIRHTAFKAPTPAEREHDFLWRIRRALPSAGEIGVFDRSHYEDVLVVRVHNTVPKATWSRRYATINRFEAAVTAGGTAIVKVMLHVSRQEQKARLAERLDNPAKHWKYNPHDVDERELWPQYQQAYQDALSRCSTPVAPWHVVPADKKWYARWAVQQLLVDALSDLDPHWPAAGFDVRVEQQRLART